MIIQALHDYYEILSRKPDSGIAPYGYSVANVSFALNLSKEGELLDVIPLKVLGNNEKSLVGKPMIVPEHATRTTRVAPHFMCDNSSYVLGIDKKGKSERSIKAFEAFKELHRVLLGNLGSPSAIALMAFLENWKPGEAALQHPALKQSISEILEGGNIVFRLSGSQGFINEDHGIKRVWEEHFLSEEGDEGQCLATGMIGPIERLHPLIKNVKNAQSSGASLVSFNENAYESYNKQNGFISPVNKRVAFSYGAVLNHMLAGRRQKVQVGDATVIFWAESDQDVYVDLAAWLLDLTSSAFSQETGSQELLKKQDTIRDLLQKIRSGQNVVDSELQFSRDVRFYILGLSPNAGRLSVRFFQIDTFGDFLEKASRHYHDMELIKEFSDQPSDLPVWMLIKETVSPKSSNKEANPLLSGAFFRSIISGTPYPAVLFNEIMIRIRNDMDEKGKPHIRVNYVRASIIKAYLVRKARFQKNKILEEVFTVGLNKETNNTEYLLGRLFAILEKAQLDVNRGINATIKDRYFSSACATPAAIFPILIKLAQNHISKSDYGKVTEKRLEEVMGKIERFPAHLTLEQQGTFVLGYYHQRVAFFEKFANEKTGVHGKGEDHE